MEEGLAAVIPRAAAAAVLPDSVCVAISQSRSRGRCDHDPIRIHSDGGRLVLVIGKSVRRDRKQNRRATKREAVIRGQVQHAGAQSVCQRRSGGARHSSGIAGALCSASFRSSALLLPAENCPRIFTSNAAELG